MARDREGDVEREEAVELDARAFKSELDRLRRAHAAGSENIGSYECVNCSRCASCMFCRDCTACYRCNYCQGCEDCSNCNHCTRCSNCHGCAHCVDCEQCVGSAYLTLCTNCSDCSYCFGCVGLQKKDFHILNRRYDRTTYFKLVAKLKRELGIRE